uniref:P53 and DNA damage-regulated protein 1 n=1 Tax=Trichuris muris TaxID=70415 RepID=A0A5S6QSX1_TRIMR
MDVAGSELLELVYRAEIVGQSIAKDRETLLELGKMENDGRQALSALRNLSQSSKQPSFPDRGQVWYNTDKLTLQVSPATAEKLIRNNLENLANEKERLNKGLKEKVKQLYELRGESSRIECFGLNPIDANEAKALHSLFK